MRLCLASLRRPANTMHHLKRELDIPVDFHHTPTRAHVTLYGDDSLPQIVCLHGIGSTGQESYGPLAEHLSQKYQLVAPDWIGCGGTTRLLGPKDFYSSDYCSEWLANFFNAAKNQGLLRTPVNVLASSMSAIGVAKSYPMIKHMLDKIVMTCILFFLINVLRYIIEVDIRLYLDRFQCSLPANLWVSSFGLT